MNRKKHPAGIDIADLLLPGRKNAQPMRQLITVTGMDSRTIRRLIQRERRAGAAICCDCATGYYLAETEEEKAACVKSLRHRAAEIFGTARALEKAEIASEEGEL